jgi:hypothetical protein
MVRAERESANLVESLAKIGYGEDLHARQLGTLRRNDRVERARVYVKESIRRIKVANIEAI